MIDGIRTTRLLFCGGHSFEVIYTIQKESCANQYQEADLLAQTIHHRARLILERYDQSETSTTLVLHAACLAAWQYCEDRILIIEVYGHLRDRVEWRRGAFVA